MGLGEGVYLAASAVLVHDEKHAARGHDAGDVVWDPNTMELAVGEAEGPAVAEREPRE
jgi:hypothetical protein